ncbi:hypothetical protein ACQKG5_15930, partial [Serratia bockelmannii]
MYIHRLKKYIGAYYAVLGSAASWRSRSSLRKRTCRITPS